MCFVDGGDSCLDLHLFWMSEQTKKKKNYTSLHSGEGLCCTNHDRNITPVEGIGVHFAFQSSLARVGRFECHIVWRSISTLRPVTPPEMFEEFGQ